MILKWGRKADEKSSIVMLITKSMICTIVAKKNYPLIKRFLGYFHSDDYIRM